MGSKRFSHDKAVKRYQYLNLENKLNLKLYIKSPQFILQVFLKRKSYGRRCFKIICQLPYFQKRFVQNFYSGYCRTKMEASSILTLTIKNLKKHMAYLNLDKHQKNPYSKRNKNILLRRNIGHEYYGIFSVLKCDL